MTARKWGAPQKHSDGTSWQYYIESKIALMPMYMQGTLIWPFQRYWITYPMDAAGNVIDMYRSMFPSDPGAGPS